MDVVGRARFVVLAITTPQSLFLCCHCVVLGTVAQPVLLMTYANPVDLSHARVRRLYKRLEHELGDTLLNLTNQARVVHMLTLVTQVGPDLSDAHHLILARFGLATFLFDDSADRSDCDVQDIVWRAEQLCSCMGDAPVPELHFDPTARLLRKTAETLRAAGADPRVFLRWQALAQASFRAMATQRVHAEQRRQGIPVPIEELREAGRLSVAIEALSATSWVLLRVPYDSVDTLAERAQKLASGVRLANDLRSLPRDREEGSTNTLSDLSPSEISLWQDEVDIDIQRALMCNTTLPVAAARAATLDLILARAIIYFYRQQDFHDHLHTDWANRRVS